MSKRIERIESLDSIRGIAAMIVVFYHCLICYSLFYSESSTNHILNNIIKVLVYSPLHIFWAGKEAVLLFFVLSGFVLALPFINAKPYSYKSYAIRRICRIYLPYVFVMFLSSFLMTLISDYHAVPSLTDALNHRWEHPLTLKAVFSYILMLGYDINNVNGATWSLIHEMRISLFFPLIMLLVTKLNWRVSLIIGLVSTSFLWIAFKAIAKLSIIDGSTAYLINSLAETLFYSSFFVIGAVLAKYRYQIKVYIKEIKLSYKVGLLVACFVLMNISLLEKFIPFGKSGLSYSIKTLAVQWIVAIGIVILLSLVISSSRLTSRLEHPALLWIGKTSYSIYLIHGIIIVIAGKYIGKLIPMPIALLLVPVLTLLVAGSMYKYIESPANKLGKKLITRKLTTSNSAVKA